MVNLSLKCLTIPAFAIQKPHCGKGLTRKVKKNLKTEQECFDWFDDGKKQANELFAGGFNGIG